MNKTIAVIGGGVAGLAAAAALNQLGYRVLLYEKEASTGGNVRNWDRLFPSGRHAVEVANELESSIAGNTEIFTGTMVTSVSQSDGIFHVQAFGPVRNADAVLITTGFELFDARKKEEYGYGIFENVITSADLEKMFTLQGKPVLANGAEPKKVAFIHCVGSRDEKVNNPWCSRVCCVTAVKQAIEVREALPDCEVYNFYMDLRMFGTGYEQLYKQAQVKGVNFIRGRLSEANETRTHQVMIKAEDTLVSKPLQLTVDLVVLMAGMTPVKSTLPILDSLGLIVNEDGFAEVANAHTASTLTMKKGVFVAGACSGPANITESVNEARAAALQIHNYFIGGIDSSPVF
ncbi:MAG: CoB--CoM heterodisulfide reductase iron-sulfur subunit A family protein [Lentimicrobium sp.]|nr:CoB--CoM heterodisulfide reductase iron-sulfur subunit A family protein [Lentimicrobium sp.]